MPTQLPRLLAATLAVALLLSGGPPSAAPSAPVGQPQLVSPRDGGDHYGPDVAAVGPAEAVVVWQARGGAGSDIFARRLGPDGAPLGPPLRVNAAAADEQRRPAVAALAGGGFVVAWDTNTSTVWARRLGPDGAPLDARDILVAAAPGGSAFDPDVAALPDGGFAVAWESESPAGAGVSLRRFGPDGLSAGPEQAPYGPTAGAAERRNPALAAGADGALAIVWEEAGPAGASSIMLSRYAADGAAVALAAPVAASDADALRDPALALAADGAASVAWTLLPKRDRAASRIELRGLDAAGAPLGPALTVSAPTAAERGGPAVAAAAWGALVAWTDQTTGQGGAAVGLAARALLGSGAPDGDELYPRLPAAGGPARVVAAAAAPAGAWVVWSEDTIGEGAEGAAVYARRLAANTGEAPGDRALLPLVSRP